MPAPLALGINIQPTSRSHSQFTSPNQLSISTVHGHLNILAYRLRAVYTHEALAVLGILNCRMKFEKELHIHGARYRTLMTVSATCLIQSLVARLPAAEKPCETTTWRESSSSIVGYNMR
eukprot:COSAG02_NODE_832_length_16660_cov_16.228006_8_plen_120_part_00